MSFDKWKEYPCCNVQQDNFCFLLEVIQHGIPAVLGVKIIGFSRAFSLLRVFAFVLRVFAYIYFCIHTFIMFNCFLNQNVEARNTAPNFNLQSSTAGAVAMVWFNDTPKVISRYIKEFYELQGLAAYWFTESLGPPVLRQEQSWWENNVAHLRKFELNPGMPACFCKLQTCRFVPTPTVAR